ncbi:terpene cyclase/mutase family protein [Cohnella terricola]|uniref:Squalene--hopene cyclase n=1 Tax=Cohnella terricola TaxID=1289167 RepID=A0A559JWC5_9BACL|nr:prenyltransferase/squalene oxidase repeat-containing protein [Cohnella terricola]TVY04188.1 squalene--hopene cyclase [Cohnella terricola]
MGSIMHEIDEEILRLTTTLIRQQKQDGSWRFCFENGVTIDAYTIILLRVLKIENEEELIRQLHDRILAAQRPEGYWQWYQDEKNGNLSLSVEAYYALLYSRYSQSMDEPLQRAERYIRSQGGLGKITSILTRSILAATGQAKWPRSLTSIPLEMLLLPDSFPINFFEFSGYSRVHLAPMLIMADRRYSARTEDTPDLDVLLVERASPVEPPSRGFQEWLDQLHSGMNKLIGAPHALHEAAIAKAERFMLERIEADGTFYSYASSTVLMILALLALGYDNKHPLVTHALYGLTGMCYRTADGMTIQNSPSAVWDTALLSYALQESGTEEHHLAIQQASSYLLALQHSKLGDWSRHNPNPVPGGWGFSESNTINPDVDDTTAALRAIRSLARSDSTFRESWNLGLNWVLSMQNQDGGWPAFEKNVDKELLTWVAIDGAKSAAIDPSEADLTGRTLEYLGNSAGFDERQLFVKRGTQWLADHQEEDGSWYGRWGICYIYGTWAALTGLTAVIRSPERNESIRKGADWLLRIQNADGGWGESCSSDRLRRYVPLGESTPSQTAWALDALIAVHSQPTDAMNRGIRRLISSLHEDRWAVSYPTGAGLPGHFYVHYHSYKYIWPLLALSHFRKKYEGH